MKDNLVNELGDLVNDCISRQAAINALGEKPLVWDDLSDFDLGKAAQWSDDVDAIKALPSAQPEKRTEERTETHACDLIDRQAALDALDTWDKFGCDPDGRLVRYDDDNHYVPYVHYDDMVHAIKHLPSVQETHDKHTETHECVYQRTETHDWIPVTERLPERGKDVLVTRDYDGRADHIKSCRYVEVASCYGEDDDVSWNSYSDEYKMTPKNHRVVAWMPLPEAYKGEEE